MTAASLTLADLRELCDRYVPKSSRHPDSLEHPDRFTQDWRYSHELGHLLTVPPSRIGSWASEWIRFLRVTREKPSGYRTISRRCTCHGGCSPRAAGLTCSTASAGSSVMPTSARFMTTITLLHTGSCVVGAYCGYRAIATDSRRSCVGLSSRHHAPNDPSPRLAGDDVIPPLPDRCGARRERYPQDERSLPLKRCVKDGFLKIGRVFSKLRAPRQF